jgi:SWIM zinc finger
VKHTEPIITDKHLGEGYAWVREKKSANTIPDQDYHLVQMPAGAMLEIPKNLKDFKSWTTFDDYFKNHFSFWTVKMLKVGKWETGTCDCPNFYKKLVCKHLIGVAAR